MNDMSGDGELPQDGTRIPPLDKGTLKKLEIYSKQKARKRSKMIDRVLGVSSTSSSSSGTRTRGPGWKTKSYFDEKIYCNCTKCKGCVLRTRRMVNEHVFKYDTYVEENDTSKSIPPTIDNLIHQMRDFDFGSQLALDEEMVDDDNDDIEVTSLYKSIDVVDTDKVVCHAPIIPSTPLKNRTRLGRIIAKFETEKKTLHTSDLSKDVLNLLSESPIPHHLLSLVKPFNKKKYSCWPVDSVSLPKHGTSFSYWGHTYIIKPSEHFPDAGLGLFSLRNIDVPFNSVVTLMPYAGPQYNWEEWHALCRHQWKMQIYGLNANAASLEEKQRNDLTVEKDDLLYIDGRPDVHGNIAGYINSSIGSPPLTNCEFEERTNGQEEYFSRHENGTYVMVIAIRPIKCGEELFIKYSFNRPLPSFVQKSLTSTED